MNEHTKRKTSLQLQRTTTKRSSLSKHPNANIPVWLSYLSKSQEHPTNPTPQKTTHKRDQNDSLIQTIPIGRQTSTMQRHERKYPHENLPNENSVSQRMVSKTSFSLWGEQRWSMNIKNDETTTTQTTTAKHHQQPHSASMRRLSQVSNRRWASPILSQQNATN